MSQPMRVLLRGGPYGTPQTWDAPSENDETRVKVPSGNGYEHFEITPEFAEFGGEELRVYHWRYRTTIAE
jgi:hypothetical protein